MARSSGRHPGDSGVQRAAEGVMMKWLEDTLGRSLKPSRIDLPGGAWIEVDGLCSDPPIVVEAWAHQGSPKSAQKNKVMTDAFKLVTARSVLGNSTRLILLFADEAAAQPFQGHTWMSRALETSGVEVLVAAVPTSLRDEIIEAQKRQFR